MRAFSFFVDAVKNTTFLPYRQRCGVKVDISNWPTMFARIGIMRALNRNIDRVFSLDRKDHHWGRRKLARDR